MNQNSLFILTLSLLASANLFGAAESNDVDVLRQAITHGQAQLVCDLIAANPALITNENGKNLLLHAALSSQWQMARVLVEAGVIFDDDGEKVPVAVSALTCPSRALTFNDNEDHNNHTTNYQTLSVDERNLWLMVANKLDPEHVEELNERYGIAWQEVLAKRRAVLDARLPFPKDILTLVLIFAGPVRHRESRQEYPQHLLNNNILPALSRREDSEADSAKKSASARSAFQKEDLFSDDEEE